METEPLEPLNVGDILGQTLAALLRRFLVLFVLAVPPSLALAAVSAELQRRFFSSTQALATNLSLADFGLQSMILTALGVMTFTLAGSLVILSAKDVVFGPRIDVGRQLLQLARSLPVLMATTAVALMVIFLPFGLMAAVFYALPELMEVKGLLAVLLVLAGATALYLSARIWVYLPAVLIGGDGFDAIGRATWLSRGYRWPILGALLLLAFIDLSIVLSASLGLGLAMQIGLGWHVDFNATFSPEVLGLNTLVYALILMLMAVFTVHLYSRLRELKEGLGLGDVAAVFE